MQGSENKPTTDAGRQEDRPSASLLVRCWLEPQRGGEPVLRGYVRNLKTGEEAFIGDLGTLGDRILRELGRQTPQQANQQQVSTA